MYDHGYRGGGIDEGLFNENSKNIALDFISVPLDLIYT